LHIVNVNSLPSVCQYAPLIRIMLEWCILYTANKFLMEAFLIPFQSSIFYRLLC